MLGPEERYFVECGTSYGEVYIYIFTKSTILALVQYLCNEDELPPIVLDHLLLLLKEYYADLG